jgi:hypothetical protein
MAACQKFLSSVPDELKDKVGHSLKSMHSGGFGLRAWVNSLTYRNSQLPHSIPEGLIQVYFNDPEAFPLHECEDCGLAIPVRPNRRHGLDGVPEHTYFESCPSCGGRTGLHLFVARREEPQTVSGMLRRRRPR